MHKTKTLHRENQITQNNFFHIQGINMRLFLHGQSQPSMIFDRLKRAPPSSSILLLSGWTLSEDAFQVLQALLEFLEENPELDEIILQNCSGRHLQTLMFATLQSSPRILTIRYDKQQDMPSAIACGLIQGTITRIRRLNLRGMDLTLQTAEALQLALPENFPFLDELSIKGNLLLEEVDRGISILGRRKESSEDAVNRLGLMLEDLPNLKCLELEYCHLDDEALAFLLERSLSSCKIETLELRGNQSQEQTIRTLSYHLASAQCTLKNLNLTWQRVTAASCTSLSVAKRGAQKSIPRRCMTSLDDLPLLSNALTQNTSLRRLVLSENKLSDVSVNSLSRILEVNRSLQILELKDCSLSKDSLFYLARSLPKMHLKSLQIDGIQKLSHQEEEKILKALFLVPLTNNVHLHDLAMNCKSQTIEWILERNRSGRCVATETSIPARVWPKMLERADRFHRLERGEEQATKMEQLHLSIYRKKMGTITSLRLPRTTDLSCMIDNSKYLTF
jgi:hypothetical protein